ncbi:filament-like plant protein 4 [Cryptomeria japonica]|uniref:filament-like plant protein 4 n=1 Tax=Cryptomeria japonica TaxID=3369 RepID=UPI0025ABFF12|nr:filament-like plant protein 4 [Cryptomeria japonica]XP_057819795.1 filament-like plant protein 4 [Cryptomeria japonica]XP_057819796.1 filament-like plant protein 4 [Cryptomeria japonica]
MDRWGWSRKKKSSEKNVAASDPVEPSVARSASHNEEQDTIKTLADHVRMSEEAMIQVHESEEKVKYLNEKLSAAMSEIGTKESLVKQHAKVAEDAVSGWEKAQNEALASKQQVESLTQQKAVLEERVTHLDGALKECMKQLRHVREEQEHKIHEVVISKTRECDKIKFEFEAKLVNLEQQLLQASAENTALSRSLQERSRSLAELNQLRSQAEAEVKVLQVNIESYQNENSSLKYELNVLSKELEIRNEERNMSMKSADAANKQQLETVKKIAKLEAECQRLRGLLRKKLPGPAALAQMKMEVENWGKESGEGRKRRSPVKASGLYLSTSYDSSYDDSHEQGQKESEFLTERLFTMEEETKMLKEALSKRNSELQASRMMCARTASKLSSVEKQLEVINNGQKRRKPALDMHVEQPRGQTTSNPPSLTSVSEDGNDDEISCAESWASALISELSHIQKEKSSVTTTKALDSCNMDLMDDFTEMEKLASLPSPKMDQTIGKLDDRSEKGVVGTEEKIFLEETLAKRDSELQSANQQCLDLSKKLASVQEELTELQSKNLANENTLINLQARLDMIFEAQAEGGDVQKVLQDVQCAMAEEVEALSTSHACDRKLPKQPVPSHDFDNQVNAFQFTKSLTEEGAISPSDTTVDIDVTDPKLESTVCRVVTLVESIANEARSSHNFPASKLHDLDVSIEMFTKSINQILYGKPDIIEFVSELSSVLVQLSEMSAPAFGKCDAHNELNMADSIKSGVGKSNDFENGNLDPSSLREDTASSSPSMPSYTSSPNANTELSVIQEEKAALESEVKAGMARYAVLQEELTQAKAEKAELDTELLASKEKLTQTNAQLTEAEHTLVNLQEQLTSALESKKIAENELETMTSSKADLESQLKAAEVDIKHLHEKVEALESELKEEHKHYVDAEAKCQELQESLQRKEEELASLQSSIADNDSTMRQKREIEAAAEKIAECQKTILNVGRQLNALSSPNHSVDWSSDKENGLFISTSSVRASQKESHDTKRSRHNIEDLSNSTSQETERNGRIEQGASWSSYTNHASGVCEPNIPVSGNNKQKTGQYTSISSGSPAHDLLKNNESIAPIHEDCIEGHPTLPSSSDTEPSSSSMALVVVKPTHRKIKIPRSSTGISKSLTADEGKPSSSVSSSEKHGSGFSRFFSRTRTNH